jgi:hypothetical protein
MVERLEDDEAANAKLFGRKFTEFLNIDVELEENSETELAETA